MRALIRWIVGALVVSMAQSTFAYETPVHSRMTQFAFTRSVQERDFLRNLGVIHKFDSGGNLLTEPFAGDSVLGWAMRGSVAEDSFIRSIFHFYDPIATNPNQGLFHVFQAAPDWAFNTVDNPTYSLPGTRDSLYGALTNTDTIVRPKMWRDTFRGVGQFTHLLQDMAQPQHVRNDDHFSLTENFYFFFPDYSRYEKHTLWMTTPGATPQLQFTGYPTVNLPSYRAYWDSGSSGKGLAQVVNLNFVSEGTNVDTGKYGSPLGNLLAEEVIPQVFDVVGNPIAGATNITVQYLTWTYTDPYRGASVTNNRLSTFSLFDFQRMQLVAKHAYSLYNTNHETYAAILVPQAVGYSAGLINRFFRGSLAISAPDEQVYGIVDHATTHQTDPLNGFVGFGTIKLKVANTTPNNEAINGGKLIAVAKFHRNGCYKEDLSGEFSTSGPACDNFPTDTEEIVVSSNEYTGVSLDSTPKPFTFMFGKQIPLNATDLYLQVVYRGPLGNDQDEIAVGTKDVFEPTYLALFNSTDQLLFNGVWTDTTSASLLPTLDKNNDGQLDAQFDRTNLDVAFGFTTFADNPVGIIRGLPPARYSRMVLLTDQSPYRTPVETVGVAFFTSDVKLFTSETNQFDVDTGFYRVSVFRPLRGIPSWGSLTMYRSEPFQDGDLSLLPDLPASNKAPFPITTLTFQ